MVKDIEEKELVIGDYFILAALVSPPYWSIRYQRFKQQHRIPSKINVSNFNSRSPLFETSSERSLVGHLNCLQCPGNK